MLAATDSSWNMEREIWNEAISSQKDLVSSVSKSPFRKQKTDETQGRRVTELLIKAETLIQNQNKKHKM